MKKNEYLSALLSELKKKNVSDAADILSEYEQHFAFKLTDGFTEEEIAAKLGDPAVLAAQFVQEAGTRSQGGRKAITVAGLCLSDIFAGCLFILLAAWQIVLVALSLACIAAAICLLCNLNPNGIIPPIPYGCAAAFSLSFIALSVLSAIGTFYFAAMLRQMIRSYARFHHNALASASGKAALLPSLPIYPQLPARTGRRLRKISTLTLLALACFMILGYLLAAVTAGSIEFWHAWEWFVK